MNPGGGGFMQGGHLPPPPHGNNIPPMGKVENIPVTAAQVNGILIDKTDLNLNW